MKIILILIAFVAPLNFIRVLAYRIIGYKIDKNVRIGLFNYINVDSLHLEKNVRIGNLNKISGAHYIHFMEGSSIGSRNKILTDHRFFKKAHFIMGKRSRATHAHYFDVQISITIGDDVVIGGNGCSFWNHGFDTERKIKYGDIVIGNNCYIGAYSHFNLNSGIGNKCIVGLGSIVTKKLLGDGIFYGGNPAKKINNNVSAGVARIKNLDL